MIELLLQAERALAVGLVDQAERMYRQAADADPRNAIAVVGLARVALERGDQLQAYRLARRALEIDPEDELARRLVLRLEQVIGYRGEALPATDDEPAPAAEPRPAAAVARPAAAEPRPAAAEARSAAEPLSPASPGPPPPAPPGPPPPPPARHASAPPPAPSRPGLLGRLLRRSGR